MFEESDSCRSPTKTRSEEDSAVSEIGTVRKFVKREWSKWRTAAKEECNAALENREKWKFETRKLRKDPCGASEKKGPEPE
jgi:hypothetical protein